MYNSQDLIFDDEMTLLSYNQCINRVWTVDELLLSDLWSISQLDDLVYKCIPLFNCDKISSSNSSDVVLEDNKCLILNFDDETRISCRSDDTGGIHYHNILLHAYAPYTQLDLVDKVNVFCIVYDEYLNTCNNVTVDVIVDDIVVSSVNTDSNGLCRVTIDSTGTVRFSYDNVLSDSVVIT